MKFENQLISICIPSYNSANFITDAVESWQKQTYQNIEIIIQDDDSSDDTFEIAKKLMLDDARIQVYKNSKNLGIGKNWNEAYEKAKGNFIVIFNADDIVYPDFIEKCLGIFQKYPKVEFVCSAFEKRNQTLTKNLSDPDYYRQFTGLFNQYDHRTNYRFLSWCFCLGKAESFKALEGPYGLFYPTQCCDADLWIELDDRKIESYYIGESLGIYRQHDSNHSKVYFAEFESVYRDIIWRHPLFFKTHFHQDFKKKIKTLIYYVYIKIKDKKKPDPTVLRNFIVYEFFK